MKIKINDVEEKEVDKGFIGLAKNHDGDICYFSESHVIWFKYAGHTRTKEDAICYDGPFYKFLGHVTLEND